VTATGEWQMDRIRRAMAMASGVRVRRNRAAMLLACMALALAGCGGGEQAAPAPASTPAPAATPGAPVQPSAGSDAAIDPAGPVAVQLGVDELLKRARQALTDQRLIAPPDDNAIEYYLQVLAQEPSNPQATQALVDVFPLAAGNAERALAQRQVDEAARIVALLDRVDPRSYTVATLRTKLAAAQAAQQRETQQQAQQAAAAAAAQAAARIEAATPPPAPATPPAEVPPAAAPAPVVVAPARAPTPPVAAPVTTPSAAPAAAPAAQPARVVETRARPVRQAPPVYPIDAARRRQEGWVELEFVVAADGSVRDVSVLRSQPTRVFDREAVRAIQQSRFEPALRNGQPVESRERQRIEFKF